MGESEKFNLEAFPTSESAKRMLSYVTQDFYENSYVGKWIYQVMGLEYDKARQLVEELPYQFFPETATWGLMYHEIKWGLPIRENLPYEERRRRIYEKRDYRAPMTPYRMETYLKNATGFDVFVADVNEPGRYGFTTDHPNKFKVYFFGEGTLDSRAAHEILDRIKQSHTMYTVNDMIEIEIVERGIEKIILSNIVFKLDTPFWGMFAGGKRIYEADIKCSYLLYVYTIDSICQRILLNVKNHIIESICAIAIYRYGISFGKGNIENSYNHSIALHTFVRNDFEDIGNMMIITKTSDYWFLDGEELLDGTKKLNAIYRKETVE